MYPPMTGIFLSHLIFFTPLIVTASGWLRAYRKHSEPLHPFALTLLIAVTGLAIVAAVSFVYFDFNPVHLPPWESPEVRLFGWFLILGPASTMAVSFLALGNKPKWLFWVLEIASLWLTGLGLLAFLLWWENSSDCCLSLLSYCRTVRVFTFNLVLAWSGRTN